MGHYKLLNLDDVPRVIHDGTVRVSSFSYFRKLEQPGWIGDRLEGASEAICDFLEIPDAQSPEAALLENWNENGHGPIRMGPGAKNLTLQNITVVRQLPDAFIYCVSWGSPEELSASMRSHSESASYRGCIRVKNLRRLSNEIFASGRVRELRRPVSEIFRRHEVGLVRYKSMSTNIRAGHMERPSPFLKDIAFERQCEARIVLSPLRPLEVDRLTIEISLPGRFFEEVRISVDDELSASFEAA